MQDQITALQLRDALLAHSFRHANEVELHCGIEEVLTGLGLAPEREVRLGARDRIDFMVDLPRAGAEPVRMGIEAKIAGRSADVRRQLARYADHNRVDELLLVTTVRRHLAELAPLAGEIGGKPLGLALLNRGLL